MTPLAERPARQANPLVYAFSAAGSLDPGTKLLDVGLDGCTPIAALRTLVAEPLHMSVALHEVTHFVSLENALGHVMGFLAMRAKTIAEAIAENSRRGKPVDASWIALHAAWHRKYRLLLELWRPLLEGLAVFAQTHVPDEAGDAMLEPLNLLTSWKVLTLALADAPVAVAADGAALDAFSGGFLSAAYRAIGHGPQLQLGERSFAVGLEFVQPEALRPYFLGHAYLRALQAELARACPVYASSEVFFNLVLRILRSSTRGLLADGPRWDHPSMARRVYGWLDTARQAPAQRVAALPTQPDAVDVLHFLATGDTRLGYAGTMSSDIAALNELVPEFWQAFVAELARRHGDGAAAGPGSTPPALGPLQMAERLAGHWLRGSMSLNLSSGGTAWVVGWIPDGLAPLHALALQLDEAQWWLAVSDDDLALIAGTPAELPRLPPRALLHACDAPSTLRRVSIDCFVGYVSSRVAGGSAMLPELRFELANAADARRTLLAEIAPARPGLARAHLRVLADAAGSELHRTTMQMRRIVRDALAPAALAEQLRGQGQPTTAQAMRDAVAEEELAAARVQAQVERRILASVLQREPAGADLTLLAQGVGAVPGAADVEPLIAASYGRPAAVDAATAARVRRFNDRALDAIGIAPFDIRADDGAVRYRGLAGARTTRKPFQPEEKPP